MRRRGNVLIQVFDLQGREVDRIGSHNLVVGSGLDIIRDLLGRGVPGTGSGYAPTHIAIGTDGTDPVGTDELLKAEAYRDQISHRQGSTARMIYRLFVPSTLGNGGGSVTYREAGLFDSQYEDAGHMLARVAFSDVQKDNTVQLLLSWQFDFQGIAG